MKLKDYIKKVWDRTRQDKRTSEMLDWLDDQGIIDKDDWVTLHNGDIIHCDDAFVCEHCDTWNDNDQQREVITRSSGYSGRRSSQYWCEDCADSYGFRCERTEEFYESRHFTCVEVEGSYVCLEDNSDDIYCWNNGDYHWEPEPEEEEDEDSCGRGSYHGDHYTRASWKKKHKLHDLFGVELEIKANDKSDLSDLCITAKDLGFIPEFDGSLCESYGVEIVAPPIALHDYRNGQWNAFLSTARGKATGWDAGTGYGIHISLRRSSLNRIQQFKFLRFFGYNQTFCEGIAGRKSNTYADYSINSALRWGSYETGRYAAAALREGDRIEVRIFRSTLKKSSFLKNVQFVAALVEFVRCCSIRDTLGCDSFVEFVSHRSRRNRYRELVAFIDEKGLNNGTASVS